MAVTHSLVGVRSVCMCWGSIRSVQLEIEKVRLVFLLEFLEFLVSSAFPLLSAVASERCWASCRALRCCAATVVSHHLAVCAVS